MQTINLSKRVYSQNFIDTLVNEKTKYETILSDNPSMEALEDVNLIKGNIQTFFSQGGEKENGLIILKHLNGDDLFEKLEKHFKNYTLICTNIGMASIGYKINKDTNYLEHLPQDAKILFPLDKNHLLLNLKPEKKTIIFLSNQEVDESIYQSHGEEDEIQIIEQDKANYPSIFFLSEPKNAKFLLIGTGNLFSTLIQLANSYEKKQGIITCINTLKGMKNEHLQNNIKKMKKIIVLVDHEASPELLETLGIKGYKNLNIINPEYESLTTMIPEYQHHQLGFDLEKLEKKIDTLIA